MIVTENGYSYSCTTCPKTGQPCAAGLRLARQLGCALQAGDGAIPENFELAGHGRMQGACGQGCDVVYRVCKREFRVFCGVPAHTEMEALDRFATAFLGDGPVGRGPFPKAMIIGARQDMPAQGAVRA